MSDPKTDKSEPRQASTEEPIRHKGPDRSIPEEKKAGLKPDGNGGTGKPPAFPPHN